MPRERNREECGKTDGIRKKQTLGGGGHLQKASTDQTFYIVTPRRWNHRHLGLKKIHFFSSVCSFAVMMMKQQLLFRESLPPQRLKHVRMSEWSEGFRWPPEIPGMKGDNIDGGIPSLPLCYFFINKISPCLMLQPNLITACISLKHTFNAFLIK